MFRGRKNWPGRIWSGAEAFEHLQNIGHGRSREPGTVCRLAFLMIKYGETSESDERPVGNQFGHRIILGCLHFLVIGPHRPRHRPFRNIGVERRLLLFISCLGLCGCDRKIRDARLQVIKKIFTSLGRMRLSSVFLRTRRI